MLDNLSFDPVFRPGLIAALAVALVALACYQAWQMRIALGRIRAGLLLALRCLLICGLAIVLMRPQKMEPQPRPSSAPVFSIIVDRSASMQTKDAGKEGRVSRADAVSQTIAASIGEIQRQIQEDKILQVYEFSDQLRSTTAQQLISAGAPEGEQTNIATALVAASEGNAPQAGMLLISDGRDNHVSGPGGTKQAARYLSTRKIPVWTAVVGQESNAHDAYVLAQLNQNFLYARQPGSIDVTVDQSGYKGWPATVRLKREGVEVGAQQVMLGEGPAQINFPVTEAAPGLYQYAVEVDPLPGEADKENNRRAVFARVTDKRTQVLVIEAVPSWDSKFMLRALRRDTTLDITSFFQLNDRKIVAIRQAPKEMDRDPNKEAIPAGEATAGAQGPARMPRTKEELFAYDVIILGQGADRIFSAEEMRVFKDYLLERGGNLVFARGKTYGDAASPLAELEPVIWSDERINDLRLALTDRGRETFNFSEAPDAGLMLRELPSMLSVTRVQEEKSLAVVLARTESGGAGADIASISWQHYGKGKVVSMGNSGLWRWSLLPDNTARYQGIYEEFWSQIVRWLVAHSDFLPDQEITFEANRNSFHLGEEVRLVVRTRNLDLQNYRPALELTRRNGARYDVQLTADPEQSGVFSAIFAPEQEGEYTARLQNNIGQPREDVVRFTAYQDLVEKRLVSADPGLMAQIAKVTGGEVISLDDIKSLPARLKHYEQATAERRKPADAWDHPKFFYLLVGLLGMEWFIRRKLGLL